MADTVVRFLCPSCGKRLKAPPAAGGRKIKCPTCGSGLVIPGQIGPVAAQPFPPRDVEPANIRDELIQRPRRQKGRGRPGVGNASGGPAVQEGITIVRAATPQSAVIPRRGRRNLILVGAVIAAFILFAIGFAVVSVLRRDGQAPVVGTSRTGDSLYPGMTYRGKPVRVIRSGFGSARVVDFWVDDNMMVRDLRVVFYVEDGTLCTTAEATSVPWEAKEYCLVAYFLDGPHRGEYGYVSRQSVHDK